jgi:crotonobetainyl-CoA:carnitine CoA-transferase CaiB-like acyl-CoA transferase
VTTALAGLRVLDLTWGLPGAITTMVLADNGAEVAKVEPPGGDPQRAKPAFAQWHRGKRSVVIDLATDRGRRQALQLAGEADVVVESWRPGVAERLGLGYDRVAAVNPAVIYCAITGFGPRGPLSKLKGYEAIVAAKAGVMAYVDRPRYAPIAGASFAAAQGALQGILAALYERGDGGVGQKVETSLAQGLTAYDLYHWLSFQDRERYRAAIESTTVYSPVQGMIGFTRDGRWMQLSNFRPKLFQAFLRATGLEEWYRTAADRHEPPEAVAEVVLRRLHERTLDEWMAVFLGDPDIGVEPFRTPMEAMEHEQMIHNGHVVGLDDPDLGPTRQIGPLVKMAGTPARLDAPAPRLGSHTPTTAFSARDEPALTGGATGGAGSTSAGPLSGVTIVELAWFYAAPFGLALLADLGARVIKVEGPEGDPHRYQSGIPEHAGVKGLQGKESAVIDYRTAEGLAVLDRLVATADLVMCNYRQADKERSRDSYERLRPFNPDLVYLYAAAYGSSGTYNARPAFAPTMAVAAGQRAYQLGWDRALHRAEEITFEQGMERLARIRAWDGGWTQNGDSTAAVAVGTAALLGLVARQRTGIAQYTETTMICSNAYVVSDDFFDFPGKVVASAHDEDGVSALYRLYPASDGWIFLAAPQPSEWEALCAAVHEGTDGRCDLATDPRFAHAESRAANDDGLAALLRPVFATRAASEWEAILSAHDVAGVEISQVPLSEFTISSSSATANGFVAAVEHPLFGPHLRHGPIATLSRTPGRAGPGSLPGQHTRRVLTELGYTPAELAALRERGVIAWPEEG